MTTSVNFHLQKESQDQSPIVSIVIPVRNEGANLRISLKFLAALVEVPYEVLLVYDFPTDSSVPVVKELNIDYPQFKLVLNTRGVGVSNALLAGIEAAKGDYISLMLADDTGPMTSLGDMIALMEDGCQFVSCTRYAHGGYRLGGSRLGYYLSITANKLFYWLAGCVLTDATTGIKMFRRDIFKDFPFEARPVGWAVVFEMAMKAQTMGLTLGEVPIISIDRLYGGKSTFKLIPWVQEYSRWFIWGLLNLRKNRGSQDRNVRIRIPER